AGRITVSWRRRYVSWCRIDCCAGDHLLKVTSPGDARPLCSINAVSIAPSRPVSRRVTLCFFFQAEDGIRDFHVTGVQTCALPIYSGVPFQAHSLGSAAHSTAGMTPELYIRWLAMSVFSANFSFQSLPALLPDAFDRSEERRVGRVCRLGSARVRCKKRTPTRVRLW